ncbi:MAG: DUF423 domain-containing protein [Alphaproteobacteria bacterium]|nr:DUF423 domain-containing protein [Alphaproteobacteria bacterium]
MPRPLLAALLVLIALALALGAIGAHVVPDEGREQWRQAVFWHAVAAVALLALSGAWERLAPPGRTLGVVLALAGAVAFCGALYVQALTGTPPVPMLAPIGGTAQIAGWLVLAAAAMRWRLAP